MIQDCGRKVNDRGWGTGSSRSGVHEQNSRNRFGIDDVVSTPFALIVFDQRLLKPSDSALPRDTKPGPKVHQQVRGVDRVGAGVDFLPAGDTPDRFTLSNGVGAPRKT